MPQTATNPKTGEMVMLIGDEWVPVDRTATNPETGERLGFVSGVWVPIPPVAKPAAPAPAPAPAAAKPAEEESTLATLGRAFERGIPAIPKAFARVIEEAPEIAAATLKYLPGSPLFASESVDTLGKLAGRSQAYREATQPTVQEMRSEAEQAIEAAGSRQYGSVWEEEGFGRKLGSLAETVAESAPATLAGLATGVVTRNPMLAGTVMAAGIAPQSYEGIRERQKVEGIDDVGRALAGTAVETALDVLTGAGGKVLSTVGKPALRELLTKGLWSATKRVAETGLHEAGTEVLQTAIEQIAGGSDPDTKQAMLEALEAGLAGFVGGGAFGTVGEVIAAPARIREARLKRLADEETRAEDFPAMEGKVGEAFDAAYSRLRAEGKTEAEAMLAASSAAQEFAAKQRGVLSEAAVPGGTEPSVPSAERGVPAGEPVAEVAGPDDGGVGTAVGVPSEGDVLEGAGKPALTEPTAKDVKATVPAVEDAFAANASDFEETYGVKNLNAEQKKQAARIILQSPEVDVYDAIDAVLQRGVRLRGAPAVAGPTLAQQQRARMERLKGTLTPAVTPAPAPVAPSVDEAAVAPVVQAIEAPTVAQPTGNVPSLAETTAQQTGLAPGLEEKIAAMRARLAEQEQADAEAEAQLQAEIAARQTEPTVEEAATTEAIAEPAPEAALVEEAVPVAEEVAPEAVPVEEPAPAPVAEEAAPEAVPAPVAEEVAPAVEPVASEEDAAYEDLLDEIEGSFQGDPVEGIEPDIDEKSYNLLKGAVEGRRGSPEDIADALEKARDRYAERAMGINYRTRPAGIGLMPDVVRTHIGKIISGWKAKIKVEVVGSLDEIPAALQDAIIRDGAQEAQGFVAPDGTIYVLAHNLDALADATATIYHEALGHMGLKALFGKRLDAVLQSIYNTNGDLRAEADAWTKENPDTYAADANPHLRALEEVLVSRSEGGQLKSSIWRKLGAVFKEFGRKIGMNLEYTDAEVGALLAMAHDQIVNGPRSSAALEGLRYMVSPDRIRPSAQAAKTFLKELGLYTNRELSEMPSEDAIRAASRVGIDQEWVDYFNSRQLASRAQEGAGAIKLPQPDMAKYLPTIPKYMAKKKAKAEAPTVARLNKKVADSHTAAQMSGSVGDAFYHTRGVGPKVRLLSSTGEAIGYKTKRALLSSLVFSRDIIRLVGRISGPVSRKLAAIQGEMNRMNGTRNQKMRVLNYNILRWRNFNAKFKEAATILANLINTSTLAGVDVRHGSLQDVIANDRVYQNLVKEGASQRRLDNRQETIKLVYSMKEQLEEAKHGGGEGNKLYEMAVGGFERSLDNEHRALLGAISQSGLDKARQQEAIKRINEMYADTKKLSPYAPLFRDGDFWVRIGKGKHAPVFRMESEALYLDAIKQGVADLQAAGDTRTAEEIMADSTVLRYGRDLAGLEADFLANEPSDILKKVLEALDSGNLADPKQIKDLVFQMYAASLPKGSMYEKMQHRTGRSGFSADVLRAYTSAQINTINRLTHFEHSRKLRRLVGEAYGLLEGNPNKLRLMPYVDEMALRVAGKLAPSASGWDAAASVANKAVYYWMLTGVKSALNQFFQLPMVGLPILGARYGYGRTGALAARYIATIGNKMGTHKVDETGTVVTDWGQPSMGESKYINEHPDPVMRDALQFAWKDASERGILDTTYSSDTVGRKMRPSEQYEAPWTRVGRTAAGVVAGGMHHAERISREIMYMSAFELEFKKRLGEGMDAETAKVIAADTAADLTQEAMLDYSDHSKPRLMKNPIARVALQFFTFSLQMVALLVRNFVGIVGLMPSAAERLIAAKQLFGILGMTFLFAGVTGLPGYSFMMGTIQHVLDSLRGDDEEPDDDNPLLARNFELWFRTKFLPEYFGNDAWARAIEMGPVSEATDINFGASVGLDSMFFRDDTPVSLDEQALESAWYSFSLGALGSTIDNIRKSAKYFHEGDFQRGAEAMAPAFAKNPLVTKRLSEEGYITPNTQDEVKNREQYTAGKLFAQFLGYGSTELAQVQKVNRLAKDTVQAIEDERGVFTDKFGRVFRDQELGRITPQEASKKQADLWAEVDKWNNRTGHIHPLTRDNVVDSLVTRAKERGMSIRGLRVPQQYLPYVQEITGNRSGE